MYFYFYHLAHPALTYTTRQKTIWGFSVGIEFAKKNMTVFFPFIFPSCVLGLLGCCFFFSQSVGNLWSSVTYIWVHGSAGVDVQCLHKMKNVKQSLQMLILELPITHLKRCQGSHKRCRRDNFTMVFSSCFWTSVWPATSDSGCCFYSLFRDPCSGGPLFLVSMRFLHWFFFFWFWKSVGQGKSATLFCISESLCFDVVPQVWKHTVVIPPQPGDLLTRIHLGSFHRQVKWVSISTDSIFQRKWLEQWFVYSGLGKHYTIAPNLHWFTRLTEGLRPRWLVELLWGGMLAFYQAL